MTKKKKVSSKVSKEAYNRQRNLVRSLRRQYINQEKKYAALLNTLTPELYELSKKDNRVKRIISACEVILQGEKDGEAPATFLLDQVVNCDYFP